MHHLTAETSRKVIRALTKAARKRGCTPEELASEILVAAFADARNGGIFLPSGKPPPRKSLRRPSPRSLRAASSLSPPR
ncbi:hypothetical protein OPIT5_20890 [Opitutaceae bacterium TAV5]|nr:hypothetical protein OPIT5_20890 [Opitutaceae bacterium TAV5]